MLKTNSLLFILSLLMCACSSYKPIVLSEYYRNQTLSSKRLLVAPVNPFIENADDVVDHIGVGEPQEVYFKFFSDEFSDALKKHGRIDEVVIRRDSLGIPLSDTLIQVGSYKHRLFSLPRSSSSFLVDSLGSDYVLILNRFKVSPSKKQDSFSRRLGAPSLTYLRHELQFVLWDCQNNNLISYGYVEAESLLFVPKERWASVIRSVAEQIVLSGPFSRN